MGNEMRQWCDALKGNREVILESDEEVDVRVRLRVLPVAEKTGNACREINQLKKVVDHSESLGFISLGQSVQ